MVDSSITGGIVAVLVFTLAIGVFVARLAARPALEYWLGLALVFLALPLLYLLLRGKTTGQPGLYMLQLSLMMAYLVAEFLLDYVFKYDFRSVRWMTITYAVLFFGATGGMLGVASDAGKGWMYGSIVLFLVMAVLAFVQRGVTGM
jgi:hypothetical protein